jgi:hypothetical protein
MGDIAVPVATHQGAEDTAFAPPKHPISATLCAQADWVGATRGKIDEDNETGHFRDSHSHQRYYAWRLRDQGLRE